MVDPAPSPEEFTIGAARPSEVEALSALAVRSKAHWGYPADWLEAWGPQLALSRADLENREVFVARGSAQPVGFYSLAFRNCASLEHLWMDPRFMGRGLGRRLVEHAVARTALRGYPTLQVDADPHAESFYVRMGAIHVGWVPAPVSGTARLLPRLVIPVPPADA
ncbi:MAG: GNAT family N-acetyltransferase [Candidatus Palauibacterales bacterium]|nr:GNAT family N-acetyltransferase [Candidatus Palauibacterales bacterium]MDP2528489.1 GNAT family N-acetyltransferase [Candidatus Palauibacterales bacterium]MDP2584042.1 GNAT family N-acetyltransferase [Candidatus Palauibacterales bacterium]